ncbi:MAG: FliI/YscN family ATPase [bacterium]
MNLTPKLIKPDLSAYHDRLRNLDPVKISGRIAQVVGLVMESTGPGTRIGELCEVHRRRNQTPLLAETVGFRGDRVLLMPIGGMDGVGIGSEVVSTGRIASVKVGPSLLGRILDGLGNPMDGGPPIQAEKIYPLENSPPNALERKMIDSPLPLGVRSIDSLMTCARGQRIGIFSGSGVGKSTLLGMIARNGTAQVNVISLVGERGREVREFIEHDLGPEGLARSVVIVATSDQPSLVRLKAALVATAIAEYFRDCGMDVLLMMDSVTRLAMAQREVGLAIGEPPSSKGYTPSVFAMLPKLLERAGNGAVGSITGIYTVLVEGDDTNEPIADAVRSILDGHIVLTRKLTNRGHYPPIDVLQSLSRVMPMITSDEHRAAAVKIRDLMASYSDSEDLISIGAYQSGANTKTDKAIAMMPVIEEFLKQGKAEPSAYRTTLVKLMEMANA